MASFFRLDFVWGKEEGVCKGRRAVSFLGVFWFSGLTAIDTGHSASTVIMLALFSTRPLPSSTLSPALSLCVSVRAVSVALAGA